MHDSLFYLAQAGSETGEKAKELLTEVTTWKVTKAVAIVASAYIGSRVVDRLLNWFSEKVPLQLRPRVKQSLPFWQFSIATIAIGAVSNLFLNLSRSNLLALTGTISVALGFAFKDYISSVIAGIVVLFEATYRVGDRVWVGDRYGEIIRYGLRSFRLRTLTDDTVTIPHNRIWSDDIINTNDGSLEAQVVTHFYLSHQADPAQAIEILYQAAYTSKYTQIQLPIAVIFEEKPWGTHFQLKSYPIDARSETVYKTDLSQRAKQAFAQYNLAYPPLRMMSNESFDSAPDMREDG